MLLLLFGATVTLAGAWGLAVRIQEWPYETRAESFGAGGSHCVVTARSAFGSLVVEVSRDRDMRSWSPQQATGAPNSSGAGDQPTAWASKTAGGSMEWLELDYATPVIPSRVDVYENYTPGALVRVTAFKADGTEVDAWRGVDPTPKGAGSGVSKIPVSLNFETWRIKLYIDSIHVPGWNEVDAVGLVDRAGKTQWAADARASSSYADVSSQNGSALVSTGDVAGLIPSWSGLAEPLPPLPTGMPRPEDRAVEAHGWPLLAFWSPRPPGASGVTAPASTVGVSYLGSPGSTYTPLVTLPAGNAPWQPVMPLRPIWRGLCIDALLYGCVAWVLLWLLTRPRRFLREVSRVKRGCCVECGYDLGYDFQRGCPECGWRRGPGMQRGE